MTGAVLEKCVGSAVNTAGLSDRTTWLSPKSGRNARDNRSHRSGASRRREPTKHEIEASFLGSEIGDHDRRMNGATSVHVEGPNAR